jgi:hypothetical protein
MTKTITLAELVTQYGANAYVFMDLGSGAGFGPRGVSMDYDDDASEAYHGISMTPVTERHVTEDGRELEFISDWIDSDEHQNYAYRIGF